ncbi:MAG: chalcone isomerase family protein [Pirellula sp.]|jgi:hypothetical protein|nr:chalcone isomerase family protein [Pirellula sp.]
MSKICSWLAAFALFSVLVSQAYAELGPQLKIGEQVLKLNGAGTRTKTFVQIYESGLYLLNPTKDARAILDADELMAIRVRITSGFVSRSSLVSSLQEGLAQSTGGRADEFASEIDQLQKILKEEVKRNDVYDFVYVPEKGLHILKNGKVQGAIQGLAFKKAFYGVWLSDTPVDKDLRQAMLSGNAVR